MAPEGDFCWIMGGIADIYTFESILRMFTLSLDYFALNL